jgi:hypothetical protein
MTFGGVERRDTTEKLVNSSIESMPPQTTIMALFKSYGEAAHSVLAIEKSGVRPDAIKLIDHDVRDAPLSRVEGGALGAAVGVMLGGGAGLMAALGVLSIPGLGPVVAAGWLAATTVGAVVGAAAGVAVGSLASSGGEEEAYNAFAGGLSQGGAIVTVRAGADEAPDAERILKAHNALDVQARADQVPAPGWMTGETTSNPPVLNGEKSSDRRS